MAEYIEREALAAKLQEHRRLFLDAYGDFCYLSAKDKARVDEMSNSIAEVFNAPAADVAPVVHGEWINITECANEGVYCSVCHKKVYKADYAWCNKKNKVRSKYCPNCGADMRGVNDE